MDKPATLNVATPPALRSASGERWRRGIYRFTRSRLSLLGLAIVVLLLVVAALGPAIAPWPEHISGSVDLKNKFLSPSSTYWFGTNEVGQDIFPPTVAGARISLRSGRALVAPGADPIGLFVAHAQRLKEAGL